MFSEITKEKIQVEKINIDKECQILRMIKAKIKDTFPDDIEIRSIATILHSFYNGVENIICLILKGYNEKLPNDLNWHKTILNNISNKTLQRDFSITEELKENLENYLAFRHFFRHSYGFQLDWELLSELVNNMELVWENFVNEIKELM